MPRHRLLDLQILAAPAAIAGLIFGLLLGSACPSKVQAQTALQAAMAREGPVTPAKRAELYQTLRRHAQVLEAQAAIVKTVAKLVGPTVVHIEAEAASRTARTYDRRRQVEEAGSGVIIQWNDKHYILTNQHVIRGASTDGIKIKLADGRQIHPTKLWGDADSDIAVMAIPSAPDLVAAPLGDSDQMEIGDFVLAVGSPFGLSHSVTFGIISAKGRRDLELGDASVRFQDFIQTDAAINPGNSGGPLVNLQGEIIGINTAIASSSGGNEGIGFAIPINMFRVISRQLIEKGKVTRAFLGVNLDSRFGPATAAKVGLPFPLGARITGITKGTPAEAAKLQVGDVILQFNEIRVEDDAHLVNLVGLTEVGKMVSLVIFRDRKPISVELEVADRSKFDPAR